MEIFRALGLLAEPPGERHAAVAAALGIEPPPLDEWKAAYTDVFLMQCYPYASVYLGEEGMLGGEARDRIAGFWRALGLAPPAEPDHLAALLGFYARLADAPTHDEVPARRARAAFFWEHLLSWLPPYLDKVEALGAPVYAAWASILRQALAVEAKRLDCMPRLPLHLREAPALAAPTGSIASDEAFLCALLAPVRSGMLLTRADLARACREQGLGLRMGERLFVLKTALAQDEGGMLAWLGTEAHRAAAAHGRHVPLSEPIARFWSERAAATASRLDELAARAAARYSTVDTERAKSESSPP